MFLNVFKVINVVQYQLKPPSKNQRKNTCIVAKRIYIFLIKFVDWIFSCSNTEAALVLSNGHKTEKCQDFCQISQSRCFNCAQMVHALYVVTYPKVDFDSKLHLIHPKYKLGEKVLLKIYTQFSVMKDNILIGTNTKEFHNTCSLRCTNWPARDQNRLFCSVFGPDP